MNEKESILKSFCCKENSFLNRLTIAKILQVSINVLWIGLAIIALWIAGNEIIHISSQLISSDYKIGQLLHEIVTVFIYIEIVAMVIKYFEENYHFPLRYIIYIAITALARHIIGDFEHAYDYSIAILLLAVAYGILKVVSYVIKDKDKIPPYDIQ
ncbi:MAG: phosphate-starvation-inducible PsiE family protein [Patescibacteria group bacterium]|nr:phosphate-starvation-inducible PsiE family protein [Patescibacteria group bacterium]